MGYEEALRRIKEAAETGATELDFFDQELIKLPPEIGQLTNLTALNLGGNQLSSLPPEIGQLNNLTELYLWENHLFSLSPEIFRLTKLTNLVIDNNQLSCLPAEIIYLTKLEHLDLSNNQLTALPPEIVHLPKIEDFDLYNNPLISPPYELATQGIEAIREYFISAENGTRTVAEVKVILVGEGASGKTSLTRCLRSEPFNPHEKMTDGIRIKPLQIEAGEQEIKVNLWDFGGQEIMHATHQFFLSRRSLYVLVLDGRRDERPEYWLRYIESFGGDSPVLVLFNKYDTNPSFDLDRPSLQEKYPFIKGFLRTSCNTGQGIEAFKTALIKELTEVPLTKNQWPVSWFRAKEKLEQRQDPQITYERFETVCQDAGVSGTISRDVLADFLHDLGIAIHFKDFGLDHNYILDPKWVTGAVYKIINAQSVAERKGVLRLEDLKEILVYKKGDEYRYERRDHPYFIKLMQKFELCYMLEDGQVLLPQLFAVPRPSFAFDEQEALRFVLHYQDFLPPAVMPRFIVKRHCDIKGELRWRDGVVLENKLLESTAVVRVDNETKHIHIKVNGVQPKAFLTVIMLSLREINAGFDGLKVSERLPMPDDPERTVDFEHLRTLLKLKQKIYTPEGSKRVYKIPDLLATVDKEKILKLLEKAPADITDKESLVSVIKKHVKAEPELFGFGADLKGLAEDLWLRYRARRS